MLCYVMLCYVMLCYGMLCYVMKQLNSLTTIDVFSWLVILEVTHRIAVPEVLVSIPRSVKILKFAFFFCCCLCFFTLLVQFHVCDQL